MKHILYKIKNDKLETKIFYKLTSISSLNFELSTIS